jgi:hypothetical protein
MVVTHCASMRDNIIVTLEALPTRSSNKKKRSINQRCFLFQHLICTTKKMVVTHCASMRDNIIVTLEA